MLTAFNLAQPYYSHRINQVNRCASHTNVMDSENCARAPTPGIRLQSNPGPHRLYKHLEESAPLCWYVKKYSIKVNNFY